MPAAGLGGWAPGATPQPLPEGVAQLVEKGADLVMQIHYHPSGKPETDQSSIGLTFTDQPRHGLAGMLAGPEGARPFRRETILSRLTRFLTEGGEPAGMNRRQMERLRKAIPLFDKNHNGKLEPEERAALLDAIGAGIR